MEFDTNGTPSKYKDSTIRQYLNGSFLTDYIDNIEGGQCAPTGAKWEADSATVYWTGNYYVDDSGLLTVKDKNLVSDTIIIPNKINRKEVKGIKSGAFAYCSNLFSVVIPVTITSIGDSAFDDCTGLSSLTYLSTKDDWNARVSKTSGWNTGSSITTVKCTDGDITISGETPSIMGW